ncbi:hypothetical protein [Aeromonas salmonicida]|uniref:hypothetical protein n=1 Tax=Aeromonas salmonicida TaxID=645 RepID=UPI0038B85378
MKDCKGQGCTSVEGEHSVACLYEYALARLGLTDTPEMRVLFWDAKDALVWIDETDSYVVPDLLGPCDCSLSESVVVTMPSGTVVKINGIPVSVEVDTPVRTHKNNVALMKSSQVMTGAGTDSQVPA